MMLAVMFLMRDWVGVVLALRQYDAHPRHSRVGGNPQGRPCWAAVILASRQYPQGGDVGLVLFSPSP